MKALPYIVTAAVLVVAYVLLVREPGPAGTAPASDGGSSREIELTPVMQRDVTDAIQRSGYNCPQAKLAYAEGPGPRGTDVRIYCGPAERSGVYERLIYRVTIGPDQQRIWVEPWQ